MKFGVFCNPMVLRAPGQRDWEPGQERRALTEMLEQIRFADSLGFDYAFIGQHHFMPQYAHNSATEVLLRALAATTIEQTHADGLLLNQQFGYTKHEYLMESLEIWGTQIIPEFREREAEHQAWRKKQLDGLNLPVFTSVLPGAKDG